MRPTLRLLVPLAAAALPLVAMAAPASADSRTSSQATLNPLNHSNASGRATVSLNGTQGTVKVSYRGLAAKFGGGAYPHVQHIHGGAQGACPTMSNDKNGDGVISTTEGAPASRVSLRCSFVGVLWSGDESRRSSRFFAIAISTASD